jgi:aldehyde dehydrogenase (NAD+)
MLDDNECRIVDALRRDLHRHPWEAHSTDIFGLKQNILHTLARFRKWVRDEKVPGGLLNFLGNAKLRKEPWESP